MNPILSFRARATCVLIGLLLASSTDSQAGPKSSPRIPVCAQFVDNPEDNLKNDQADLDEDGLIDPYCGTKSSGPLINTDGRFLFATLSGRAVWVNLGPGAPFPAGYYQMWLNTKREGCGSEIVPDVRLPLEVGHRYVVGIDISIWVPDAQGNITEYFLVFGDYPKDGCDAAKFPCSNGAKAHLTKTAPNLWLLEAPAPDLGPDASVCLLKAVKDKKGRTSFEDIGRIQVSFAVSFWDPAVQ